MSPPNSSARYDLLVFDLDGTLVDTLLDLSSSVNYALEQLGLPLCTVAQVRRFVGNGARALMARALGDGNEHLVDDALATLRAYYPAHAMDQTRPYPGVVDTLSRLPRVKSVVYTNKPQGPSELILRGLGLMSFFDACHGEGSGIAIKPDPAGLLSLCERYDIPPERTVMIGDGDTDVIAAKRAGIDVYAATYGFRGREKLEPLEPTGFFDDFSEIERIVAG